MFEKASKLKIRFSSDRGLISVEDLWDLSLTELDKIAIALNNELKAAETESFIKKVATQSPVTQLMFDIVKRVIEVRLADLDKAEKAEVTRLKKQQIMSIIADKESDELKGTSLEDLQAMLNDL